jgi:hypothetical protein
MLPLHGMHAVLLGTLLAFAATQALAAQNRKYVRHERWYSQRMLFINEK